MVAPQVEAYDEFSYLNYAYPQTHPDRLRSIARLHRMNSTPIDNCRVLELGCGDGANLMPLALTLPGSEFVGLDRAAKPIANGEATIATLQLANIKLLQLDLTALPEELGQFDYIIAHGLYSWVPAEVRDAIFSLCRARLTPQGVAYVSYNTYPGCHLRNIIREAMRFHTRDVTQPRERIAQGRALIKWLAEAQSQEGPYQILLREFNEYFQSKNEGALYHDDLADINYPVYFHEFVTHAAQHGLQFLSEAVHFDSEDYNFSPDVGRALRELGEQSIISKAQYLDLLEGRAFRQTLLCHHENKLDRSLKPEIVSEFLMRSRAQPDSSEPSLNSDAVEKFKAPHLAAISTSFPLAKAAILHLGRIYPRSANFESLVAEAHRLLGSAPNSKDDGAELQALAEVMMKAYGANVVDLHLHDPSLAKAPGERPQASPLARLQAQKDGLCTSLLHETVKFEDFLARQLIFLLDGTRDRAALQRDLVQAIESNAALIGIKESAAQKAALLETGLEKLEEKLVRLGQLGFLLE